MLFPKFTVSLMWWLIVDRIKKKKAQQNLHSLISLQDQFDGPENKISCLRAWHEV